jgi:hypothetical protein
LTRVPHRGRIESQICKNLRIWFSFT